MDRKSKVKVGLFIALVTVILLRPLWGWHERHCSDCRNVVLSPLNIQLWLQCRPFHCESLSSKCPAKLQLEIR